MVRVSGQPRAGHPTMVGCGASAATFSRGARDDQQAPGSRLCRPRRGRVGVRQLQIVVPPGASGQLRRSGRLPAGSLPTLSSGTLTIGTDNPAYSPYFTGGPGHEWTGQYNNDPYTGKGFEDAVAYAVAKQLGFPKAKVKWAGDALQPVVHAGAKDFDFYLAQVSITARSGPRPSTSRAPTTTSTRPWSR